MIAFVINAIASTSHAGIEDELYTTPHFTQDPSLEFGRNIQQVVGALSRDRSAVTMVFFLRVGGGEQLTAPMEVR